ncbi:MAG TPA: hypothetical protein VLQ93_01545 [Myxococcaceae bacterium]|nr:hypothetical protein [Myxococcaceae bacterium]
MRLPQPLRLEAPWWLVLTVSEGEALWPLGASAPALEGGLLPTLHRLGEGVWYPWEPSPGALWGPCRLRLAELPPPPPFQVELRRGPKRRTMSPEAEGRGVASAVDLEQLNASKAAALEVVVRSADEPVSGAVRLSELRVAIHNGPG